MALVPVWGSDARSGLANRQQAAAYATWLGNRYRQRPNIIWLNGGDVPGSDIRRYDQTIHGESDNSGIREFDPPGEPGYGNDWVLILDSVR